MLKKKINYIALVLVVLSSMMLTGCIPANDHVGKPAAKSYKNSYYGGGYYNNGGYYYR